ncbi:helix-turn-helix transcriptional regulator [Streptomyces sp. NPDC004647]|uniref:helix-turn-helix domain-containing protein n=1 Tax=Streptomyces sp. NPDC004647 TaxID=3154671 RepID=UPI0033A9DA31
MATFGALLRELKDRSGLSYGTLAKRLHMSASTLHRYCNGEAVPSEYASMERFARLCKATPEELIEVHRRWVVADAARQQERKPAGTAGGKQPGTSPGDGPVIEPESVPDSGSAIDVPTVPSERWHRPGTPRPASTGRRALYAAAALAVLVASAVLATPLLPEGGEDKQTVGAEPTADDPARELPRPSPSSPASASERPTASRTAADQSSPSASNTVTAPAGSQAPVPLTVATRPYAWEDPCSQRYLINRPPAEVPPPPTEQDAPGWVHALGGVSAESQRLELTVQGTGKDTVVLQAMHVRVVRSKAPLAHNAYGMGFIGVGCGGDVSTQSYAVNLDAGRPQITPKSGQRDFPHRVSETDPEVFYVTARTTSHDVSWYLELEWSSGGRQGRLRIDDQGRPFRTSSLSGRPQYGHPLDGSEWIPHKPG